VVEEAMGEEIERSDDDDDDDDECWRGSEGGVFWFKGESVEIVCMRKK